MYLKNKETGEVSEYIEGSTFYNSDIWELVEGDLSFEEIEEINNNLKNNDENNG